ncbi:protein disulfide isomerase family protein [Pontibacter sp. H259]|uniref:protein disulfide isomerase family protein n=1 Tax=Pontibacter sp. H259 TaxID=3133421 RepID=UPI0030BF158E
MTTIQNATDADLRQLVYERDHVIVKFIDQKCTICKSLAPSFEELARSSMYKQVLFLRMDAKENPVSLKEVKFSKAPFIATYKKGVLRDCGLVSSKEEILEMLERLMKA